MKKKIKRRLWFITPIVLIIILSQSVSSCLQFRMSEAAVQKEFGKEGFTAPIVQRKTIGDRHINYAYLNNQSDDLVVFLHGAPGSWSAFLDFFKDSTLNSTADVLSMDRPGYGYSDFGKADTSLESQAFLLAQALKDFRHKRKVLVGHSLGGPVAARITMDYPELVHGLILVAPSIAPEEEKEEWYRPVLRTKMAKFLLPSTFWVTNEEIFFLKGELEEMMPYWSSISIPTVVIQGEKDTLVPPGNADFAKEMIHPDYLTIWREPDMNHFVPRSHPHLIYDAIFQLLNSVPKQ